MLEFISVEYLGVTIDLVGRNTIEPNYTEKIQKKKHAKPLAKLWINSIWESSCFGI